MKKSLSIENLLRWTYRDELPKEQPRQPTFLRPDTFAHSWGAITKTGLLGTEVQEPDVRNRYGLVPDFTAQTNPHPDAIFVWHAVSRLNALHIDLPVDWNPIRDFGDLGAEGRAAVAKALARTSIIARDGIRHFRDTHTPGHLVPRSAILEPPEWQFEKPVRKYMRMSDGRIRYFIRKMVTTETGSYEIEVDGYDYSKRTPMAGATRREYLDPDPVKAAIARADYTIWRAALDVLVEELSGRLEEHEPVPSDLPAWPWETGAAPVRRVLVDLTPRQPIIQESRPLAGPPPFRGIERKKDDEAA